MLAAIIVWTGALLLLGSHIHKHFKKPKKLLPKEIIMIFNNHNNRLKYYKWKSTVMNYKLTNNCNIPVIIWVLENKNNSTIAYIYKDPTTDYFYGTTFDDVMKKPLKNKWLLDLIEKVEDDCYMLGEKNASC